MSILKKLPVFLLVASLVAIALWAAFAPKDNFAKKVQQTLNEQKKRADLIFFGVTASEIVDGKKYWELNAKNSTFNKDFNQTIFTSVKGTFYQDGRDSLRILSPRAVWQMGKKEIFMDEPIGYDMKFERAFGSKIQDLRSLKDTRAIFSFPSGGASSESGYWFKAHNLAWKLTTKRIRCDDGIVLTKGNAVVIAKALEADVSLERAVLLGDPQAIVDNMTFSAMTIEVDNNNDHLYATGGVSGKMPETTIRSDSAMYRESDHKVEFLGNVEIEYRDLKGTAGLAEYYVDREEAVLKLDAQAQRGGNSIVGKEIHIFLKQNKVTVKGQTKVKIDTEDITKETR